MGYRIIEIATSDSSHTSLTTTAHTSAGPFPTAGASSSSITASRTTSPPGIKETKPATTDSPPAAIDKAFRIYMLPLGVFAVALSTVLFPTMSRFAARDDHDGLRRTAAGGNR